MKILITICVILLLSLSKLQAQTPNNADSTKHTLALVSDSIKSNTTNTVNADTAKHPLLIAKDPSKASGKNVSAIDSTKHVLIAVTDSSKTTIATDTVKHQIIAATDTLKVPLVNIDSLKQQLVIAGDSLKTLGNHTDTLKHMALMASDTLKVPVENADSLRKQIIFASSSLKAINEKADSLEQRLLVAAGLLKTHFKNPDTLNQQLVFASNLLKASILPADTVKQQLPAPGDAMTTDANNTDSLKQQLEAVNRALKSSVNTDSLKRRLAYTVDTLKGRIFTRLAAESLKHDTAAGKLEYYQEQSLAYTMKALHFYSSCNDTIGLRVSFDNLAHVYHDEKRYSEAKWFILQSNTLSRAKNDVPNIIASLIELASIKTDIKDYDLAMGDLNEALKLSVSHHYSRAESSVELTYANLYDRMGDLPKAAIALKRHDFIDDSIRRHDKAVILAKINAANALQAKKKVYAISYSKQSKANASKRVISL